MRLTHENWEIKALVRWHGSYSSVFFIYDKVFDFLFFYLFAIFRNIFCAYDVNSCKIKLCWLVYKNNTRIMQTCIKSCIL